MKQLISSLIIPLIIAFLVSCSSSEESTGKKQADEEGYIFDELPSGDINIDDLEAGESYIYFIQIGAFATKSNAEKFAGESTQVLNKDLEIIFNKKTNLYIVRLKEIFNVRIEAEKVRNELWQIESFSDTWISKEIK
jgi:hypothetical protein